MMLNSYLPKMKIAGVAMSEYQYDILKKMTKDGAKIFSRNSSFNLDMNFKDKCISSITVKKFIDAKFIIYSETLICHGEPGNLDIYVVTDLGKQVVTKMCDELSNIFSTVYRSQELIELQSKLNLVIDVINRILFSLENCPAYQAEDVQIDLKKLSQELGGPNDLPEMQEAPSTDDKGGKG